MQGKNALYFFCLMGFFLLLNACESPSNEVLHEQKYGDRLRMSDNPQIFKFRNEKGRKGKYWIDYLGTDTNLRCLHRVAILSPKIKRSEEAFAVLGSKRFPLHKGDKYELKDWFGDAKFIIAKDTYRIVILKELDKQKIPGHGFPPDLIPSINSNDSIEYLSADYLDSEKRIIRLNKKAGSRYIRLSDRDEKILLMNTVMIDLKSMKLLDSRFCTWREIEFVSTNSIPDHEQARKS